MLFNTQVLLVNYFYFSHAALVYNPSIRCYGAPNPLFLMQVFIKSVGIYSIWLVAYLFIYWGGEGSGMGGKLSIATTY